MNKNQIETEETDVDKDTAQDESANKSSFKDLYDDLLITLNKNTTADKNSDTDEDKADDTAKDAEADLPSRNSNLSELFDMITTQKKKPGSTSDSKDSKDSKETKSPKDSKPKEETPVSESSENSFKDNILNSQIFDSVVSDLNKQQEEIAEKKKEREKNAASAAKTKLNTDITGGTQVTAEPVKPKAAPEQIEEVQAEDQEDVKIFQPSTKKSAKSTKSAKDSKDTGAKNIDEIKADFTAMSVSDTALEEAEPEDPEDELLKAFGVKSDEDEDGIDIDNAKSKKAGTITAKSKPRLKSTHKVLNGEYISTEQNTAVFSGYKKIYTAELKRLIINAAFLIVLLYMELSPFLKLPLPYFLDPNFYNVIYILIDLQILLVAVWLNFDSLLFGIKSIFASVINIYCVAVFFVIVTFIHTLATYFWRLNAPLWVEETANMFLFNSITIFGLLLISIYNLLDINIEIMGFKVISSKKLKYSVQLSNKAQAEMEEFRDIIPADTTVGTISKTKFVSNFFSRTNRKKLPSTHEKYFLGISVCVSILLFAVLLGFKVDKYIALSTAVTVMITSVPFCSVIVNIFPLYKAQRKAYEMSSAIIGAGTVNDHSDVSIVSVYDKDIFPPDQVKISNFKVLGNNHRLETVLQHLCAVFEKLNMVVAEKFKATTTYDSNFNRNVDILSIAENGVCFVSNGQKLFMGNSEYISNIGLAANHDQNFDEQFLKSSGSILFLSSDRELIAKIYIKYEIVPEFFDIIKSLSKANICLAIRTFDPNIDTALLHKFVRALRFPVKVIKLKDQREVYQTPENMESGVVSKSSLQSLIKALLMCNKTKTIWKSNIMLQVISFLLGLGITSVVAVLGIINGEMWVINSGYILLFHAFWMAVIFVLSSLSPN